MPAADGRIEAHRVSRDLRSIACRAIDNNPAKRYAAVADLNADIARCLEGRAVTARSGFLYRSSRFLARHRKAILAWLGLAILVPTAVWACIVAHERKKKADSLEDEVRMLQAQIAEQAHKYPGEAAVVPDAGTTAVQRRQLTRTQIRDLDNLAQAYRTNFAESVRIWPGLTRSRRQLLDQTSSYLLEAEPVASQLPEGREKLASAWMWLANLEGNPLTANLHDQGDALASIRQAKRLLEASPQSDDSALSEQVSAAEQQIASTKRF